MEFTLKISPAKTHNFERCLRYFCYLVPYTDSHVVGKNNGLDNGHLYFI